MVLERFKKCLFNALAVTFNNLQYYADGTEFEYLFQKF